MEDFGKGEVGEVPVDGGGGAAAAFLDGVGGEDERYAAGVADAVAEAAGEIEMDAIAGGEVGAGLGDTDDRLAAL